MPWRDMAVDGGLPGDGGVSEAEAALWVERHERERWEKEREDERKEQPSCTCDPCESPAYGAPGFAHCAACCYGTMIESYDHDCPIEEHRVMAVRQFGELPIGGHW